MKEKIECPHCHKMVSARNITTHQKTKRCKNYIDKTTGTNDRNAKTDKLNLSPPKTAAGSAIPVAPVESSKLIIVNLKQEYDKNMETLNPIKKDGTKKKYQCGGCGCIFDNLNDGKCPDCGELLQ